MKCYNAPYSREHTANPTDAVPVNIVSNDELLFCRTIKLHFAKVYFMLWRD